MANAAFNLLITGPTGCGKTYIACALAHKACLAGLTARYFRLPRLWNELKIAKANGTYANWLAQTAKINVIILDDWGLVAPDEEQRRDLLKCSMTVTNDTQPSLPVSCQPLIGTNILTTQLLQMPFLTDSCTMPSDWN